MTVGFGTGRRLDLAVANLEDPGVAEALELLVTPEDHAHAARHSRPSRGRQSLLARGLLRQRLARLTPFAGTDWGVVATLEGQPQLRPPPGGPELAVSLSHRGPWLACALSWGGAVGVDLETPRSGRDPRQFAAFLPGGESVTNEHDLLERWTLREAWAKANGAGLEQVLTGPDLTVIRRQIAHGALFQQQGLVGVCGQRRNGALHLALVWRYPAGIFAPEAELITVFSAAEPFRCTPMIATFDAHN